SRECSHSLQLSEAIERLPVSPEVDPAATATPHQLSRPALAPRLRLVDQQVEPDDLGGNRAAPRIDRNAERDHVSGLGQVPGTADPGWIAGGAFDRPHGQAI